MSWQIMPTYDSLDEAHEEFEWELPDDYNPARDCLRKHDPDRTALRYERVDGSVSTHTYGDLNDKSDRLAAALGELGIEPGDRVAVVVPQKPANPVTHFANWKLGAVSVPLTVLFGPESLEYRLEDSGASVVVVDPTVRETIDEIRDDCPDLDHVIELGEDVADDAHAFEDLVSAHESGFESYESTPETSTAIMYTSGSTGPPKGVLHSHALWLGRAAAAYNYFDQGLDGATLWTPADWAWGAALGGTLLAGLHHGATVVAWPREGFDPEAVFDFLDRHDVSHSFMPPTALRMLMSVDDPADRYDLSLEALAAAGEPLTPEILEWAAESFNDVPVNEFYGQTELNLVVGNSSTWFPAQPESMGQPFPGYEVRVVDPADPDPTEPLPRGEAGELAIRADDRRVFFDEYWKLPAKTAAKQTGDGWFLTGDIVRRDDDGYLWFVSRADDVILTSGYRVGPMEVEGVLLGHSAVEQAGVVGIPDETRGEAIKAFVQPATAGGGSSDLRAELKALVCDQLAAYEYPREIEFVDSLPTTTTGKIQRRELREHSE